VPVPSRMHTQALALVVLLAAALAVPGSHPAAAARAWQVTEVSEADLARLSRGPVIRVGFQTRGREPIALPLEVYVAQVLSAEGEPNAADGAAQSLAVAIRTYALFNISRHQRDGYDLCATTHCQVLRGSSAASRRAAYATAGLVLSYHGAPADLYYSASCGGHTERAADVWPGVSLPYLDAVEDDVHADDATWTFERSLDDIRGAMARAGVRGRRLDDVVVETRTASGRVGRVGLPGLEPASMNSNEFRLALGPTELRSTAFTVTRSGDRLTFTGRGYGHGVGMCVIGAGRRARRGESTADILKAYYPGLKISVGSTDPTGFDVVVNATPLGMKEGDPLPVDVSRISPAAFVGEVVMKQEITPFLAAARERGCAIQIGTDMLFEQIPAYLEFFGFRTTTPDELRTIAQISY